MPMINNHLKKVLLATAAAAMVLISSPAEATHGDASEWVWGGGSDTNTARWDPCHPITWSTLHDGSPTDRAFTRAIRKEGRLTGYTFQRVDSGAMITTRVVDQAEFLQGIDTGVAYSATTGYVGQDGNLWATSNEIVVWDQMMRKGWLKRLPSLFLHEVGHSLGLGHVSSSQEVMYEGGPPFDHLGLGDRAGLAQVRPSTCAAPPLP